MFKIVSCPQCGKRICRAEIGSSVVICCHSCKIDYRVTVDKDGGVYVLPFATNDPTAVLKPKRA